MKRSLVHTQLMTLKITRVPRYFCSSLRKHRIEQRYPRLERSKSIGCLDNTYNYTGWKHITQRSKDLSTFQNDPKRFKQIQYGKV